MSITETLDQNCCSKLRSFYQILADLPINEQIFLCNVLKLPESSIVLDNEYGDLSISVSMNKNSLIDGYTLKQNLYN